MDSESFSSTYSSDESGSSKSISEGREVENTENSGKPFRSKSLWTVLFMVLVSVFACAFGLVIGILIMFFLGSRKGSVEQEETPNQDEGEIIGWQSGSSAGYFRSKNGLNSLQFSKSNDNVRYFSVNEVDRSQHDHFRVEVRVGEISCEEVRTTFREVEMEQNHERRSSVTPSNGRRAGKSTSSNDYECVGSCWCEDDVESNRRSIGTSSVRTGFYYVASALGVTLAISTAKEFFEQDCLDTLKGECPISSIRSNVESCEILNAQEEEELEAFYEMNPEYRAAVDSICAFVGTHDVLEYRLHASTESDAITMGIENAIEETKPYLEHGFGVAGIIVAYALWKMYEGRTYAWNEPFDPDNERAICCGKCKGIIGFRVSVCCELPLSDKETFAGVKYVNNLVYFAYPTLDEICRSRRYGSDGLQNLDYKSWAVQKSFVKETSIKCTVNNAVVRDRIHVDGLDKCSVRTRKGAYKIEDVEASN